MDTAMGGPRITQHQKDSAVKMYMDGVSVSDISNKLQISTTSVRNLTKSVSREISLSDGERITDVRGYEGRYKVTSFGRVISIVHGNERPREVRTYVGKSGLKSVYLSQSHEVGVKRFHVGWLVADAFLADVRDDMKYVFHVDGDMSNDHVENLIWSATKQREARYKRESKVRAPLISEEYGDDIRKKWESGVTIADLAVEYKVSYSTVWKQLEGMRRNVTLPEREDGEVWAYVTGFEGRYYISSHGRLFSTGCGRRNPRIVRPVADVDGYLKAQLTDDSHKSKTFPIHRLVAMAFCDGKSETRNTVNHIDGDVRNNHADNLEWCTLMENTRHAIRELGVKMGGNEQGFKRTVREVPRDPTSRPSPLRRFTDDEVCAIRSDPRSSRKVADEYGVNKCTIQNIRSGRTYKNI